MEWRLCVCVLVDVCVSLEGVQSRWEVGSLNEWAKVGVEIVFSCLFFITSVDSGMDCVLGVRIVG